MEMTILWSPASFHGFPDFKLEGSTRWTVALMDSTLDGLANRMMDKQKAPI